MVKLCQRFKLKQEAVLMLIHLFNANCPTVCSKRNLSLSKSIRHESVKQQRVEKEFTIVFSLSVVTLASRATHKPRISRQLYNQFSSFSINKQEDPRGRDITEDPTCSKVHTHLLPESEEEILFQRKI